MCIVVEKKMIETLNLASLVETIWTKDSKQWIVSGIKINGPKYVRPHIIDKMAKVTAPGGYRVQLNFTRGLAKHSWHVAVTEFVESVLCYLKKRGDRIPRSLLTERWQRPSPSPLTLHSLPSHAATLLLSPPFGPVFTHWILWISLLDHELFPMIVRGLGLFSLLPQNGYSLISNNHLKHYYRTHTHAHAAHCNLSFLNMSDHRHSGSSEWSNHVLPL